MLSYAQSSLPVKGMLEPLIMNKSRFEIVYKIDHFSLDIKNLFPLPFPCNACSDSKVVVHFTVHDAVSDKDDH